MLLTIKHLETDDLNPDRLVFKFEKFSLRHKIGLIKQQFGDDLDYYKSVLLNNEPPSGASGEELFKKVASGDNVLAVLPRGSGRSFRFRLPVEFKPGLIIVIGSLYSLVRDHKTPLKIQHRIPSSVFVDSNTASKNIFYPYIEIGDIRLLYINPEYMRMKDFQAEIEKNIGFLRVNTVIMDEVHRVSEWNDDFSPCYKRIPKLIEFLRKNNPDLTVIGFTAKTGSMAKRDICNTLNLREGDVESSGPYRENISFQAISVDGYEEKAKAYEKVIMEDIPTALGKKSFHEVFSAGKGAGSVFCIYADSYGMEDEKDGVAHYLNETQKILAEQNGAGREASARKRSLLTGKPPAKYDYSYSVSSEIPGKKIPGEPPEEGSALPAPSIKTLEKNAGVEQNVRFVIHMSLAGSIENWLLETGQAGRDGRRAHSVQVVDMPLAACEDDMLRRKSGVPACSDRQCAFGKHELCDYGKQHAYISKNRPDIEKTLDGILCVLDRLITGYNKGDEKTELRVSPEEEKDVDTALHRLSIIRVIKDAWTVEYDKNIPVFEVSGLTDSVADSEALSGLLEFFREHDLSANKKYSEFSVFDMTGKKGPIAPAREKYGGLVKKLLETAINEGRIANYTGHRDLFDKTVYYTVAALDRIHENLKTMRYRRLWNIKEFVKSETCRSAAFLRHFTAVDENWKCGMCDICVPDLKFRKKDASFPASSRKLRKLDSYMSFRAENENGGFDAGEIGAFSEKHSEFRQFLYSRSGNVLENSPGNITALYLAREFSPDHAKEKSAMELIAAANSDLELPDVLRLYETSPEDIETRKSQFDAVDDEFGAFNSEAGEQRLFDEAKKLSVEETRIEILGARTAMNRLNHVDLKTHRDRLKLILKEFESGQVVKP